jgi:hypothetical protein
MQRNPGSSGVQFQEMTADATIVATTTVAATETPMPAGETTKPQLEGMPSTPTEAVDLILDLERCGPQRAGGTK